MVSIKRRMAFAYSSLFIAMLGLLLYIEVWKLLLSYLPGNGAHEEHAYKRFDRSRSGEDADKELWGLSDLHSQHSSSDQEQQQRRRGRQEKEQQRHENKNRQRVIPTSDIYHPPNHHGRGPKILNSSGCIFITRERRGGHPWPTTSRWWRVITD